MAQAARSLQAYRVLLRTIRTVFDDDPRAQQVGNHQARIYFEKYRGVTEPKKIDYLINEAYEAREAMYREVMKVDYSAAKQRHIGIVEKRHLKYENGTPIYQIPNSGRGLGVRNENPNTTPRQAFEESSAAAAAPPPVETKTGLKLTRTTTTKPDVSQI